ncbi:MAG: nicotinate-nucleotide adenylyltransferase [Prevotellaceae bacterium]|jgi:nicotinate-nucleotide adenylyltransferase|nr:nicotinate-nucleotide adenylyltransferase [Prevotellaceae bacterium]
MKIGLFFGSFNPVHVGHMIIASYCAEFTDLHEVWFVPSPHNPLKQASDLWSDEKRLELLRSAVEQEKIPVKICEMEFTLPRPSYTIDTLRALQIQHPDSQLVVIMGADNLAGIERWKEWQTILQNFEVYVYPRAGFNAEELCAQYGATLIPSPIVEISSTFIRKALREGKNVEAFLPKGVNARNLMCTFRPFR